MCVCLRVICRRYLQLTYLSGVLNEPILTDTSTHQPPMSLGVFCHTSRLLIAAIQWIFSCPTVYEGEELHQGQLAAREEAVVAY